MKQKIILIFILLGLFLFPIVNAQVFSSASNQRIEISPTQITTEISTTPELWWYFNTSNIDISVTAPLC